jgi:hypothetical protein
MFQRRRKDRTTTRQTAVELVAAARSASWPETVWPALNGTSISCCCPAAPKVQVVMPQAGDRVPVELLLCGHHYRASAQALLAAGADIYDVDGMPLLKLVGDQLGCPAAPARIGS